MIFLPVPESIKYVDPINYTDNRLAPMSLSITIYSQEIKERDDTFRLEDRHLLNLSSIGQSLLGFGWDYPQTLGRKERKHRTDLILFSTDLNPKDVLRCIDEIADLATDIWWGVIYRKNDQAVIDTYRKRGARYIIPYNKDSFRKLVMQLNSEKTANASKYFHDDDL